MPQPTTALEGRRQRHASDIADNVVARLLVEVVAVTRRTILTSPALLPYTLAAGAAVTGAGALLGYGIYQLWPLLRHAIHLATAP